MSLTVGTSRRTPAPVRNESKRPKTESSRPTTTLRPVASTGGVSLSREVKEGGAPQRRGRVAAAAETSRNLIGPSAEPTDTNAVGIDEVEENRPNDTDERNTRDSTKGGVATPDPNAGVVGEGLENGEPVPYTNSNGEEFEVQYSQGESTDTQDTYTIKLGNDEVSVRIPPGEDPEAALDEITNYYSQQPENVRGAVHTINIEEGQNPADDYWAEEYDIPDFTSAATGGGGQINFWNGTRYLGEDVFDHEFGHNVGNAVRNEQNEESNPLQDYVNRFKDALSGDAASQNVPRGYSEAANSDNNSVSDYGDNAIAEDFAETYQAYSEAVEAGPEAVAEFQQMYPERYALITEEVLSRDLDVAA